MTLSDFRKLTAGLPASAEIARWEPFWGEGPDGCWRAILFTVCGADDCTEQQEAAAERVGLPIVRARP